MLLKDFVSNSIYRGTNQKLQTVLMGSAAITNAINFAFNDICAFEGKEWTFMYNKLNLTWDETTDKTVAIELPFPIKRLLFLKDKSTANKQHYKINYIEPTIGVEDLELDEIYFKPGSSIIYVPNNGNAGYILHYVHFFNLLDWEDNIPLPVHFLGVLYNITMTYLYPITGQYGDNKDANSYNKAKDQLVNLAKTDSFQFQSITGNIN